MDKLNCNRSITRTTLSFCFVVALSACGGSGSGADPLLASSDATVQGIANGAPSEGLGIIDPEFTPDVGNGGLSEDPNNIDQELTPQTGNNLGILYQDPGLANTSSNEFIEAQWAHMQTCLQVSAQEPDVTVVEGKITPLTSNDDVVRHIDGQIQASANVTDTSASIQVRSADFDGSLGDPGSYLRSIMGRYLWLSNGLAERLYEYDCAKGS